MKFEVIDEFLLVIANQNPHTITKLILTLLYGIIKKFLRNAEKSCRNARNNKKSSFQSHKKYATRLTLFTTEKGHDIIIPEQNICSYFWDDFSVPGMLKNELPPP